MQEKQSEISNANLKPESRRFVATAIILHLLIVLPLAFWLNIWMDEASSLHTTEQGFRQTFNNVFTDEKQAPLYFLLLSLWRVFSGSVIWARLFSVLFGCLSIKIFHDLTRKFFDENQARLATILFALNPFLIWSATEIRGYALLIFLTVLLLKLFADGWLSGERKQARNLFTIVAVGGLYANYYIGFVLVGCFAALAVLRRFRGAREYFLRMLIVGVAILPLLWIIKMQIGINAEGFKAQKSLIDGIKIIWNHILTLIFPTELLTAGEQSTVSFARNWLFRAGILLGAILLIKNRFRALDEKVLTFGTIASVVALFFLAAYFLLGAEYISLRHATVFFVPLAIFVFALAANLFPRKSWIVFAALLAFSYTYSLYQNYWMLAKRGDWIRVARFIEENEKPNQPILIFQNYDALSLPYHYRGINKILPDENFFTWNFEDSPTTENALRKQTEFVISEIPAETEEIWLATEELCQKKETAKACQPLEKFIEANYTVELEKDFYLEKVRFLRKRK